MRELGVGTTQDIYLLAPRSNHGPELLERVGVQQLELLPVGDHLSVDQPHLLHHWACLG